MENNQKYETNSDTSKKDNSDINKLKDILKSNPPSGGSSVKSAPCQHKYIHLGTNKTEGFSSCGGFYLDQEWKRSDNFYCERCLDYKTIVQRSPGDDEKPDWY